MSRIAVTDRSGDLRWVWARNSGGDILAMASEPGSGWINYGKPGGASVNANGVAGTTWDTGTGRSQHVYYVGSDGKLYEGVKVGAGALSWCAWPGPTGKTLTGHLAAGNVYLPIFGDRLLFVAGTTADGLLYMWSRNVVNGCGNGFWSNASGGRSWATDLPLASSTSPSEEVLSFYGSMILGTSMELGVVRWDPYTWNEYAYGNPGFPVCGAVAASEAQLSSSVYRRYVICTNANANSSTFAYAYGASENGTSLSWFTETLPGTIGVSRGNVVGSTRQAVGGGNYVLDHYIVTNDQHVYRQRRSSSELEGEVDLGQIAEATTIFGGIAATDTIYDYSRVFYLARIDSTTGADAFYLYERTGRTSAGTPEYQNYGGGDSLQLVSSGPYAEGMVAEHAGSATVALIHRPGNSGPNGTNFPRVHAFRSHDDTHTMLAPDVLGNQVNGRTYSYVVDPTVGVTKMRRSYILQLGVERSTCYGNLGATGAAVYLKRIDETGSTYTTIEIKAVQVDPQTPTPIDHPFLDIEHRATPNADRLHIAWWDVNGGRIEYAFLDDGDTTPSTFVNLTGTGGPVGPPRVAANDLGDVYVYTHSGSAIKVCKLNGTLTGCNGPWSTAAGDFDHTDTKVNAGDTSQEMRTQTGYSLAASPTTAGVVHLCYNRLEGGGGAKDIRCKRGTFSGGMFAWPSDASSVAVGPQNDGRDQFMPEVSITPKSYTYQTAIASEGEVYVFWYDRSNDPSNRFYRVRVGRSVSGGALWTTRWLTTADSDPLNLPLHCRYPDNNKFFIGDYSAARAFTLHTHGLYVTTPGSLRATDTWAVFRNWGSWWD